MYAIRSYYELEVGGGAQTAQDHLRAALVEKIHQQAVETADFDVAEAGKNRNNFV